MIKKTKKKSILINTGIINIYTTFNNTIITASSVYGNTIAWSSCGAKGFKGAKKNTPFAAQLATESVCKKIIDQGIKTVEIRIKGPGIGRDASLRAIINSGIKLTIIRDVTGIPHNGCRPPKKRRV
jgi:small subunit ribosomal protein S11